MPSYQIEVHSSRGPERFPFTVDHDRPLFPQVIQILEELRAQGVIVEGGPDAELGAYWSGKELDLNSTPAELGLSPARALELRMRRRAVEAAPVPSRPRGPVASTLLGVVGGFGAWLVLLQFRDLNNIIPSYFRLDQIAALILGGLTSAAILGGLAHRTRESVPLWAGGGLLLGGTGALLGATIALITGSRVPGVSFVTQRVTAWVLAAVVPSILLALAARRGDLRRGWLAPVMAAGAGIAAAVVLSLPALGELWLGLACLLFGAGLGLATGVAEVAGALGTLQRVTSRTGFIGPLAIREWVVRPGAVTQVRGPGASLDLVGADGKARMRARGIAEDVIDHGTVLEIGNEKLQYSSLVPS